MYKRLLVPLDGSHNAYVAMAQAQALAKLTGAEVILLNVVDSDHYGTYARDVNYYDVYRQLADVSADMLKKAANQLHTAGVATQVVVMEGNPKFVIAEEAPKKYNCDLTVIGKSGVNAMERLLTGSTTAYVVRHSLCNVLVVNDDADVAAGGY
ncbi:universal stress protein [Lacticaseibacillus baoqingensis]|uniref:Universal stress protein n=1 Tax=Lacticaseibacillus baoqingensis TaxID=2486013 RepID=A0ABW4E7Y4_9LACO|nr:universal stress protein [Lacticaseibacillus baoqingensis]